MAEFIGNCGLFELPYKNIGIGELEEVLLKHPMVIDYFLTVQKFTCDIYLVANIRHSLPGGTRSFH